MKGRWHGAPYHDYANKRWLITFEVDMPPEYDSIKDKDLTIEVKQYRQKRSLNANAYFHVLVGKMAAVLNTSNTEMKNTLISEYGVVDEDIPPICMNDSVDWHKLDNIHLRPTVATKVMDNGKLYRVYYVMRGSHTYDTKEMSRLIDGTVSEAKELGIETLTPDELERMVAQWRAS